MDAIKQPTSPAVEGSRNQTLSDTVHDGYVLANGFAQSCIDGGPPIGNDSQADPKRVSRPKDINVTHEKPESQAGKTTPGYPSLPRLGRSSSSPPRTAPSSSHLEGEDEGQEQATARCFPRSPTPSSTTSKTKVAQNHEVGKEGVCRMHKFSLYETSSRYFMVGGDIVDKKFRILKIDRTSESGSLNVAEDGIIYTKNEMNRLLNAVDDGNKSSGGLKLKCTNCWGLLGFIRFTGAYYMLMITKRSQIALIGGHYIYQVDGTELVPLTSSSSFRSKSERDSEEVRFIGILNNLDLSRSFYFSYSYDITRTLQQNIVREREALKHEQVDTLQPNHNAMFVWNHYFLQPVLQALKHPYDWCLPIVHGFIDQASEFVLSLTRLTIDNRQSCQYMVAMSMSLLLQGVHVSLLAQDFSKGVLTIWYFCNRLTRHGSDIFNRATLPMMWKPSRLFPKCSRLPSMRRAPNFSRIRVILPMCSIEGAYLCTGLKIILVSLPNQTSNVRLLSSFCGPISYPMDY